jgi:arsenate reductase-like glutaredoxin family protein
MAEKIILYTTPNCGTCDRARADLIAEGIDFEERDVMKKQEWYDEATALYISVPIVVRDGKVEYGWRGDLGCAII